MVWPGIPPKHIIFVCAEGNLAWDFATGCDRETMHGSCLAYGPVNTQTAKGSRGSPRTMHDGCTACRLLKNPAEQRDCILTAWNDMEMKGGKDVRYEGTIAVWMRNGCNVSRYGEQRCSKQRRVSPREHVRVCGWVILYVVLLWLATTPDYSGQCSMHLGRTGKRKRHKQREKPRKCNGEWANDEHKKQEVFMMCL